MNGEAGVTKSETALGSVEEASEHVSDDNRGISAESKEVKDQMVDNVLMGKHTLQYSIY